MRGPYISAAIVFLSVWASAAPAADIAFLLTNDHDDARSITLDKTGAVALGGNIHDNRVAFTKVVDPPFAAKSDALGQVVVHGLPAGAAQARIRYPYPRAPGNEVAGAVSAPASGMARQPVQLDVRAAPDRRGTY